MIEALYLLARLLPALMTQWPAPEAAESPDPRKPVGRIANEAITESSGLSRSRRVPGRFWTHNDSGGEPVLYALDARGRDLGSVKIEGVRNIDWESLDSDDQGRLWIADLGNNNNRRRNLQVHLVDEPGEALPESLPVRRSLRLRYPDQDAFPPEKLNFDCEAIFVRGETLYVLTKHRSDLNTKLYRLDDNGGEEEQVLTLIGGRENIGMVTGAALHPDGRRLAVLTYIGVWLFELPEGEGNLLAGPVRHFSIPIRTLKQAEGIAWRDPETLLISNEQRDLFHLPLRAFPSAP